MNKEIVLKLMRHQSRRTIHEQKTAENQPFYQFLFSYYKIMKLRAIVHPAEEGGYWAEVPALPGCMTQGETREELMRNLREAVEGWLAAGDENIPEGQEDIIEMAV